MDQYVEGFRNIWFRKVFSFNYGFISFGSTNDIIRLDGEDLLEYMRSTKSFQCPYFHFPKPLSTKLGFTAQRLLRDKRVRSDRPRMHLVIHKVTQFQHIGDTHSDRLVKHLPCKTVI